MINHVRTLLLNLPRVEDDPYGEVVPKDFTSIQLSGSIKEFNDELYPGNPTRENKNLVTRYYMSLLHAPEFSKYLTWFDSRLTYEPSKDYDDYVRPRLSEFGPLYSSLSSVFRRKFNELASFSSIDEDMRESLIDAYKLAASDQDKLRAMLFLYILKVEGVRRGRN